MLPCPFVTLATTSESGGFASSRFGPTLPCELASLSVWQPVQPADRNTCLPAVASPFLYCAGTVDSVAFGTVPTTLVGTGDTTFPPPRPGDEVEQPEPRRSSVTRTIP